MTKKRALEFEFLPTVEEKKGLFIKHDFDVEDRLKEDGPLSEVHERSHAAIWFLLGSKESEDHKSNSAYLRAGLNEFYALEDAARRDFKKYGVISAAPRISDSTNPLVHIMYLLRHSNVHAKVSTTSTKKVDLVSKIGGKEHEIEVAIQYLDQPVLSDVLKCSEAKKFYHYEDLLRVAEWLQDKQLIFGVGEVFRLGVSIYLREILCAFEKS